MINQMTLTSEQIEQLKALLPTDNVEEEGLDIESEPACIGQFKFEDQSDMSFSRFMRCLKDSKIRSKQSITAMAKGCIALIDCDSSYLIKELNHEYHMVTYRKISSKELKSMLEFNVKLCYTDEEFRKINDKNRVNKKKLLTSKVFEIDAVKLLLRDTDLMSQLDYYDSVHLVQVNDKCFSLRRPPVKTLYLDSSIKYKPSIAKAFIEFVASRIKNPDTWYDLINTIKYQIENPDKKACRFYLNYELSGKAGKSFASAGIAKMFDQFAMINVSPSTMKDSFNSWINDKLFVSFEEAESDNYVDKDVNTFVKRWTSIDMSSRAMHTATKTGKNYAIATMTANDPGLYGLTRSDVATKRRLVVSMFKPNSLTKNQWDEKKALINDPSFGYSLHAYIYNKWEYTDNYDPDSFTSSYDVWTELQNLKKNSCETFNALLKDSNTCDKTYPVNYSIVKHYKGPRCSYYYVEYSEMLQAFKSHLILGNNKPMAAETFKANMIELGWNYNNAKKMCGKQTAVFFRDTFEVADDDSDDVPVKE